MVSISRQRPALIEQNEEIDTLFVEKAMKTTTACFAMTDGQSKFVIKLVDPGKIEHARRILRGEETHRVHVQGQIVKEPANYNPGWSFHLKPESIDFFEYAVEVCDATITYVEEHLDEVCGSTLPDCHWCPWGSSLIEEIDCPGNVPKSP